MPLFVATNILTTPLVKVPLLLGFAACTHHGMSPPKGVARLPKERLATAPDFLHYIPNVQFLATRTSKTILCSLTLAEATILIAQHLPPASSLRRAVDTALSVVSIDPNKVHVGLTLGSLLGCTLAISGGLIRAWCHRTLGRFFTWEVGIRENHELVTAGPYSVVRHPSYFGWTLLFGGNLLLLTSAGSLFVEAGMWDTLLGKIVAGGIMAHLTWVTGGLLYRTKTEDAVLKEEFKTEWTAWAQRTPYRVIPFVY